jgi:Icc-related predicted phosphoesterase
VKILAVADTEDRALSEHFNRERYGDVDLVVSCGDLKASYLDYLISQLNVPLLYVRGNHDAAYAAQPPPGCDDLDGRVRRIGGVRFAGLEGSRWYGGKGVEYGDLHMRVKALQLEVKLKLAGGVDVLVAHAPPSFPGDDAAAATDHVHAGFDAFRGLIERYRPKLFLHGHTHLGYGRNKRERVLGGTRVIDCYGATIVTL